MPDSKMLQFGIYSSREWLYSFALFFGYIAITYVADSAFPLLDLSPGLSIGIATIFFVGLRLSPAILLGSLAAALFTHMPVANAALDALIVTAQAMFGGYALRFLHIDPIFRREQDVFRLLSVLALVSVVTPLSILLHGQAIDSSEAWVQAFVTGLFSQVILVPFFLRWAAKPSFSRTTPEIIEIVVGFLLLIMVDAMLFLSNNETLFSIPFEYYLFVPFFFIALRLRPRFVTLALVVTSVFALISFYVHGSTRFNIPFQGELLSILLAITFLVITALEEHRRANANQLSSQVATLKNAVARVTSESRAKNDFIAILAHELRNPLAPVASGIEYLKIKSQDEEGREVLGSMEESMLTVKILLNDLLDVSRISEGKIALKKQKMNLEETLDNAIKSTEHHRKERHQNLTFKAIDRPLQMIGDPVRIEQIFSNLLTNASKYSNEGDTITVQLRKLDAHAEVQVIDEGIGLSPDSLKTIFEPFQQIEHGERTKEGLGLGLSLVKDFVKMHGGRVWAESLGSSKGSKFIVRFPLVAEAPNSA